MTTLGHARGEVRLSRFFALLFAASMAVAVGIHFGIYHHAPAGETVLRPLGAMMGAALSLALPPILIVLSCRRLQRQYGNVTDRPVLIGALLFAVYAFWAVGAALMD